MLAEVAMPRPRSEEWSYFQGEKNVKCNKCPTVIANARVEKLRRHILQQCEGWTTTERNAFLRRLKNKRRCGDLDSVQVDPDNERESQKMTQDSLNKAVAEFIFGSGLALRTVELQCFRNLVLRGRPGLKVPSQFLLTGRLLDEEFQVEFDDLVELLKLQPFVSLAVDDCTNVSHLKGVNFVLDGPNMTPRLWTTVVTGDDQQTGPYTAEMIGEVIDEVEEVCGKPGFVTACTTDNAKAMLAAATILENERGVLCTGCSAHTLNLLIKDITKLLPVQDTLHKAHGLNFFLQRSQLLARFGEEQVKLSNLQKYEACTRALSLPVPTRWYCVYDCISSVIKNRDAITAVFKDSEFMKRFQSKLTTSTEKRRDQPHPSRSHPRSRRHPGTRRSPLQERGKGQLEIISRATVLLPTKTKVTRKPG
jgi:hypothetical protein